MTKPVGIHPRHLPQSERIDRRFKTRESYESPRMVTVETLRFHVPPRLSVGVDVEVAPGEPVLVQVQQWLAVPTPSSHDHEIVYIEESSNGPLSDHRFDEMQCSTKFSALTDLLVQKAATGRKTSDDPAWSAAMATLSTQLINAHRRQPAAQYLRSGTIPAFSKRRTTRACSRLSISGSCSSCSSRNTNVTTQSLHAAVHCIEQSSHEIVSQRSVNPFIGNIMNKRCHRVIDRLAVDSRWRSKERRTLLRCRFGSAV